MTAFDDLERQLLRSVRDRTTAPLPAAPRRRRWWRTRPLAVVLVALAVTGTATAAAFTLAGRPSAPLAGPLPAAKRSDGLVTADHYRVGLFPTLQIGSVGWCLTETDTAGGRPAGGGAACGQAAPASAPLIAGMSGSSAPSRRGRPGRQIVESIVDARIAGVRLHDGSVLTPRTDPALPSGWRSVVVLQDQPRKITYLGPDGRPSRAFYDAPRERPIAVQPSREVRVDGGAGGPTGSAGAEGVGGAAGGQGAAGACTITVRPGAGPRVRSARELTRAPQPTPGRNGRPFLSCATAQVVYRGATYAVAYLVDAQDAAVDAAPLPGAAPTGPRTVSVAGNVARPPSDARRDGHGWLIVQGDDADGRRAVLDAARAGVRG